MSDTIDYILATYAFSAEDKHRLTDLMARAYLTAKVNSYHKAQLTAQAVYTLKKPWVATTKDAEAAQQWATSRVDGIVETYQTLLRHYLEQTEAPQERGLWNTVKQAVTSVGEWFGGFVGWKSEQIANDTVGSGSDDGTSQFVGDVLDEVGEDSELADNGVPLANLGVTIQPGHSSSDTCAQYAGETYSLADYRSLGIHFPLHSNCIHSAEIVVI